VRFYSVGSDGTEETPQSQTIRIDAAVPIVSLTSPTAGATISRKSGKVVLTAHAADGSGGSGVRNVVFYNGSTALGTVTSPSSGTNYSFSWNVRKAALGQHQLTAVATDVAGNSTRSAAVSVTVTR
jgi:hypothetical protein